MDWGCFKYVGLGGLGFPVNWGGSRYGGPRGLGFLLDWKGFDVSLSTAGTRNTLVTEVEYWEYYYITT